jgi:hypothetical protein
MKTHYALMAALCVLIACTPLDDSDDQLLPDVPEQGENVEDDYTTEIPTNESGYDGILAADKDSDKVVAGEDIYWENEQLKNKVTVTYSGNTATVTGSSVTYMVYGADVALDLTDLGATEVVAVGKTDDGQLKIYGNSPVKLSLEGLELKSAKSAAINVQSKSILYIHLKEDTENVICDDSRSGWRSGRWRSSASSAKVMLLYPDVLYKKKRDFATRVGMPLLTT